MARQAQIIESAIVEHAPKTPKKGTDLSLNAKQEAMHWLSRSPEKAASIQLSSSLIFSTVLFIAALSSSLSAFSQLFLPIEVSSKIRSKLLPRGPSPSSLPTADADEITLICFSGNIVPPILIAIFSAPPFTVIRLCRFSGIILFKGYFPPLT